MYGPNRFARLYAQTDAPVGVSQCWYMPACGFSSEQTAGPGCWRLLLAQEAFNLQREESIDEKRLLSVLLTCVYAV
jgi:hypothetical protein